MTKKLLLPFLLFLVLVSKGQNTALTESFSDIEFIDDNVGFMLTDKILKTTDGGNNWYAVKSNGTYNYTNDIVFPTANTGYVLIKDSIFKSTDKGANWNFIKKGIKDYVSLSCFDQNNCIVATQDSIYKTTNGGSLWTRLGVKLSPARKTELFYFNDTIYASQEPKNIVSVDGGKTWTNFGLDYMTLKFVSSNVGYAVSLINISSIYKTIDGAKTWQETKITLPNKYDEISKLDIFDQNNIVAICSTDVKKIIIVCSSDAGTSWKVKQYPENLNYLWKIHFPKINTIWAMSGDLAEPGYKMSNTVECFNSITSTSEIAQQNLSIYPNPTSDLLNIASDFPVNYFITELGGKQVLSGFGQSAGVSSLSNGIYFLSFTHQNQLFTQKFVKQ